MKIKTLQGVDVANILQAFNGAFSDYFVPFQLTLEQLKTKMNVDKINLDYSVGVFDGEKLVAVILHGVDYLEGKKVVYNGGTGVIPEYRGQALTRQMYEFILPILQKQSIDYLILEVVSKNIPAIKTYQKVGYEIIKELKCYKGKINTSAPSPTITIQKMPSYDWPLIQSFWDFSPTWQNSKNALDFLKDSNQAIGAYHDGQLVGYVIYNKKGGKIQQFAVDKKFRRQKIATNLFNYISKEQNNNWSIINVDSTATGTNAFLSKIGLENHINQLEMRLVLLS